MSQAPTRTDRYGLPISTTSDTAAASYVDAVDRFLAGNVGAPEGLARAVEADDGFAIGHADLALALQMRRQGERAKAHAARARALLGGLTRRERNHVEAIATLVEGDPKRGMALMHEQIAEFPREAMLLMFLAGPFAQAGRQAWPEENAALADRLAPAFGEDWWFLGFHSFRLHEVDEFERARTLGERSLALHRQNYTPAHSIAHVFYETNDHAAGLTFLGDWLSGYERAAPGHGHVSWHAALFELALGRYDRAMAVYESTLDPTIQRGPLTLVDAASLLWRWQIYGLTERALPWEPVCRLADELTAAPGFAFNDAHAAMAYASAGEAPSLGRLIDGLRALAKQGHPLAPTGLALALGIEAFAAGRYAETIRHFEPEMGRLVRISGSHAQREVFEDTLLQAYLRTGRCEPAAELLRRRLEHRHSARDLTWLARAQSAAGDADAATATFLDAERAWANPANPELTAARSR